MSSGIIQVTEDGLLSTNEVLSEHTSRSSKETCSEGPSSPSSNMAKGKSPDVHADTSPHPKGNRYNLVVWETNWQKVLDYLYGKKRTLPKLISPNGPLPEFPRDINGQAAAARVLQLYVSEELVELMLTGDLEKKWLNAPAADPEDFILHGLAVTARGRKELGGTGVPMEH
ncbi:hypothetical protein PHLCEN_2v8867 [Hermanssonia centrifuga]|uniref:Uncharacterized protein n=1 Tax=Hermanssonia centrifuga TaxID=98765 RepID=A0A2R6NSE2_9APHY|nr:hypothetical protein PHLCEN_2v8867 [Hermanssonia centrifuga]